MATLAFYLDTRRIAGTDVSAVESGNPGIGGTEYVFLLVAAHLARRHDVLMCTTSGGPYPAGVRHRLVRDMGEAAAAATAAGAELFIVRENAVLPNLRLIESLPHRVVVWAHNYSKPDTLRACARTPQVVHYLCVSREQYAMLGNEAVAAKAGYIFNPVVTDACPEAAPPPGTCDVVYMGSLVKSKGFHILAEHWAEVVDAVPAARLHVVGSGRLYDHDADLGPLGIASPDYEKMFARYVTRRGRLRDDIVFHGILGSDKWRLLSRASVGVANPSGIGETFCITAAEFGAMGIPVVTRRRGGPIDVIEDGESGLLIDDDRELAAAIVSLLSDGERRRRMGRRAAEIVRARFDIGVVAADWERLLARLTGPNPP